MAKITAAKRHSLPRSDFVFPEREGYPIDTPNRARNALSRGAGNASPAEMAKIKAKVRRRYPSIHVEGAPSKHRADHPARRG